MSTEDSRIPPAPELGPDEIGRRCLVTGGAGYVGRAIIQRLLAAGCEVRSLDVVEHDHDGPVETLSGDLRDYEAVRRACEGIDTVFHTAGVINLLEIARPAQRRFVYEVNCVGARNVVRAAADAGVGALVHTSSFIVVMDRVLNDADETTPYATRSKDLYTLTKIEAERIVLGADEPGGLRTCATRPGGIWGVDTQSVMIRSFLEQLAAGRFKALIGNGTATMDNTHVENLVDAQLLGASALRQRPEVVGGQAYFVTDGESFNALEWFRPLAEGCGTRFPRLRLPAGMMLLAGRLMELVHYLGGPEPTLTRRGVRNLTESSRFRIDKARRELGYEPRYNRERGMRELVPQAKAYIDKLRSQTA